MQYLQHYAVGMLLLLGLVSCGGGNSPTNSQLTAEGNSSQQELSSELLSMGFYDIIDTLPEAEQIGRSSDTSDDEIAREASSFNLIPFDQRYTNLDEFIELRNAEIREGLSDDEMTTAAQYLKTTPEYDAEMARRQEMKSVSSVTELSIVPNG